MWMSVFGEKSLSQGFPLRPKSGRVVGIDLGPEIVYRLSMSSEFQNSAGIFLRRSRKRTRFSMANLCLFFLIIG